MVNKWLVGVQGDKIVFLRPLAQLPLSEAPELAALLVSLPVGGMEAFQKAYEEVIAT